MKGFQFTSFLFLLTIIACDQHKMSSRILGEWNMCEESGGGQKVNYDTCLSVVFDKTQDGFLFREKTLIRKFRWEIKDAILIVDDTTADIFKPFPDSSMVTFYNSTKMTIESVDRYNCFFLTRH